MSKKPKLTRRRVLGGFMTIGAASVVAGAGSMAYFSDEQTSEDNSVKAGSLVLNLNNGNNEGTKTLSVSNAKPGDTGSGASQITNDGTIDGYVDLEVTNIRNEENGRNSAERDAGDGSGDEGELGNHLTVWIGLDRDDARLTDNRPASAVDTEDDEAVAVDGRTINDAEGSYNLNFEFGSGETVNLVMEWELPGEGTGNDVQTDEVLFDVVATLSQRR